MAGIDLGSIATNVNAQALAEIQKAEQIAAEQKALSAQTAKAIDDVDNARQDVVAEHTSWLNTESAEDTDYLKKLKFEANEADLATQWNESKAKRDEARAKKNKPISTPLDFLTKLVMEPQWDGQIKEAQEDMAQIHAADSQMHQMWDHFNTSQTYKEPASLKQANDQYESAKGNMQNMLVRQEIFSKGAGTEMDISKLKVGAAKDQFDLGRGLKAEQRADAGEIRQQREAQLQELSFARSEEMFKLNKESVLKELKIKDVQIDQIRQMEDRKAMLRSKFNKTEEQATQLSTDETYLTTLMVLDRGPASQEFLAGAAKNPSGMAAITDHLSRFSANAAWYEPFMESIVKAEDNWTVSGGRTDRPRLAAIFGDQYTAGDTEKKHPLYQVKGPNGEMYTPRQWLRKYQDDFVYNPTVRVRTAESRSDPRMAQLAQLYPDVWEKYSALVERQKSNKPIDFDTIVALADYKRGGRVTPARLNSFIGGLVSIANSGLPVSMMGQSVDTMPVVLSAKRYATRKNMFGRIVVEQEPAEFSDGLIFDAIQQAEGGNLSTLMRTNRQEQAQE